MPRDRYRVTATSCEHTFADAYGWPRTVLYWVREGGGYVWFVNRWGQQVQPAHPGGETWRAKDGAAIRDLCKAARRRERTEGSY